MRSMAWISGSFAHKRVLLVQWNEYSVFILQLMREQESVVEEKAKQKKNKKKHKTNKELKNSETWSWEKKVLYSFVMLFIWIHGKKLPKNISICV